MPRLRPIILVVEDEPPIAETLVYALETEGFVPVWKSTGRDALVALAEQEIALVVLDVGLPDGNGFDLCRQIREKRNVPIIFLTARSSEVDRVVGLEIGGDDYLAKPFSPRELTARVRAVLRRIPGFEGMSTSTARGIAPVPAGPWQLDEARCRIAYRGQPLDLTRNEYRLLGELVRHPGQVFNRDQLMNAAWDDPGASLDRTVDAHIKTLRAKLRSASPSSDPIVTHRGLGYSLREEA